MGLEEVSLVGLLQVSQSSNEMSPSVYYPLGLWITGEIKGKERNRLFL